MKSAKSTIRQRLLRNAKGIDGSEGRWHFPNEVGSVPFQAKSGAAGSLQEFFGIQNVIPKTVIGAGATQDAIGQDCVKPSSAAIFHQARAEKLRQQGDLDAALAAAQLAVECCENFPPAWTTLGWVLAEKGDLTQSSNCFQKTLFLDPTDAQAENNLAVAFQKLGMLEKSESLYRDALRRAPADVNININYVILIAVLGRYQEALKIIEEILILRPELVKAHIVAAAIECNTGNCVAALRRIEKAIELAPDQLRILVRRADILRELDRCEAALIDCNRVLDVFPNDADALHVKAQILAALNRSEPARDAFRAAEAASSTPAKVIANRAWFLAEIGLKGEALTALKEALSLDPALSAAWCNQAFLTRYAAGDPDIKAMEDLADNPNTPYRDRMHLAFALGKAYLDMGNGECAFERLDLGNRLKRATFNYDVRADERKFSKIAAKFSAMSFSQRIGSGDLSERPIFVFGMPRSGTTLVEQILASHSLVRGIGETTHLHVVAEKLLQAEASELTKEYLSAIGRQYLERVGPDNANVQRFVDKTPSNFLYAGAIPLIFPGSRMIHCRRDPMDTCLSCYSLLFSKGIEYSYDLGELGSYYRLYSELMEYWRRVLPANAILEIDYDALVNDTQAQVERILEFCGLPWDANCLRFYETNRRVTSSSLNQVRMPIYKTSVGRAKQFRPWLGALEAALESRNDCAI